MDRRQFGTALVGLAAGAALGALPVSAPLREPDYGDLVRWGCVSGEEIISKFIGWHSPANYLKVAMFHCHDERYDPRLHDAMTMEEFWKRAERGK